ncbi:MAG: glycoside hydrolase family 28 protein [Tannerella sp.]|jgi:polygalacturonase|nr:glycoside hydrolase family 28 protein [Tannerella sp.]
MRRDFNQNVLLLFLSISLFGGCQVPESNTNSSDRTIQGSESVCDDLFENLPFKMDKIEWPVFPEKKVNIRDFGAKGDGITDDSKAINDAIKSLSEQGGGMVVIPKGVWLTGPIYLADNINLYTEESALVIFSPDYRKYPVIETSFEGLDTRRCTSPIMAWGLKNIAITGAGVFEGSGDAWRLVKKEKMTENQWKALIASGGVLNEKKDIWYPSEMSYRGSQVSDKFNNPQNLTSDKDWEEIQQWLRPVMVSISKCKGVLLEGVTFRNSPCWCLHPNMCEDLIVNNVKVFNPWYSQNGDGLDVESCNRVVVKDCIFDVGDDAICIKSGKDESGRKRGIPCRNLVIYNNTVLHGHGGFVVGSEMSGGVNNIFVKNCTFVGTDVGLRFKSNRGRGGVVENITIEDVSMADIITEPLLFDLFYSGKSAVEELEEGKGDIIKEVIPEVTEETPVFRNISIKNVYCNGARRAMYFNGLPEMRIENVTVKNAVITSKIGAELVNTKNVIIENVRIIPETGEPFTVSKSSDVTINGEKR